jgi:hypothetical protein
LDSLAQNGNLLDEREQGRGNSELRREHAAPPAGRLS